VIDHLGLSVSSFEKSKAFYEKALAPLGYKVIMAGEFGGLSFAGFGIPPKPDFWIGAEQPAHADVHVAFAAPDRKTVDAFYKAAIEAGGRDNGPPGPRPEYHAGYYGAFVLDPDGNNVEACCHKPPG
jgi:catechol 2,3-dioxygenase-like lactoylglutathione lyase family enzyme